MACEVLKLEDISTRLRWAKRFFFQEKHLLGHGFLWCSAGVLSDLLNSFQSYQDCIHQLEPLIFCWSDLEPLTFEHIGRWSRWCFLFHLKFEEDDPIFDDLQIGGAFK